MSQNRIQIHRKIYLFGLIFLAMSLPVSTFGMSLSQFILLFNWLTEGRLLEKFTQLRKNRAIPVFLLFYVIHLIGLIYTSWPDGFTGSGYNGLDDLRIKLPFLVLPIVIGTSAPLSFSELKMIIYSFATTLAGSSIISTSLLFGLFESDIQGPRDLSVFISHIRFALLLNIGVFAFAYLLFNRRFTTSTTEKRIAALGIIWFSAFLFLLQSFTGILIFGILLLIHAVIFVLRMRNRLFRKALAIIVFSGVLLLITSIYLFVDRYTQFDTYNPDELDLYTENGNPYVHYFSNLQVENGHWVGLYHQPEELKKAWNERSEINYNGIDQKGNYIRQTLERYLTALDLRKDSAGVSRLSDEDVKMIEKGFANPVYKQKFSLYPRLYEIVWELDFYFRGGNPSGHSVSQRLEYYRIGLQIWKENFWFGVGTGDVNAAYQEAYDKKINRLGEKFQHRSHNQYLSLMVAFGLIGFLFILFSIIYPIVFLQGYTKYLLMVSFLVAILSMFAEDTLETQAGATFFVFFYSVCLFGYRSETS